MEGLQGQLMPFAWGMSEKSRFEQDGNTYEREISQVEGRGRR